LADRNERVLTVDYQSRLRREVKHFRGVDRVHDLPPIFHYWTSGHVRPKLRAVGINSLASFYPNALAYLCRKNAGMFIEAVSIGAGNCQLEIRLARELQAKGINNFRIDCLDVNPHMLERGERIAQQAGLTEKFGFLNVDINDWKVEKRRYTACIANHSLHHFLELEGLFTKVRESLVSDGVFLVNDMVGRNGHRRWPEALVHAKQIWEEMPDRYKYNHRLKRFRPQYVDFDFSKSGGFEGIRAQDILPLLLEFFYFEVFAAFGNIIDRFIGRAFGPNFKVESEEDRAFIDRVAELDDRLIDEGIVKPTHIVAKLRAQPVERITCYRHWTPEHCLRPRNWPWR